MSHEPQIALFDASRTRAALPFATLIPALRDAFAAGAQVPPRHHHAMPLPDGTMATLLLMPAWQEGGYLGVKIVTVHPGNAASGLPGLHSTYLLSDANTGRPLALLDGNEITGRRTAGVAALGAGHLAREEASTLLIVGAGRVAALLADAFGAVRAIRRVEVWSRDAAKSSALAARLRDAGHDAAPATALEPAVRRADIVSCATLACAPLIRGEWLRPGTHLDLIGSFTHAMREADDAAMARGRIFVDTPAAIEESGDLVQPLASGAIGREAVQGTLADLCTGRVPGRRSQEEITIFKSVGTALSDIAAGTLAYRNITGSAAT